MFIHDIIKLQYIGLGYLPNNPYHLTSDDEMFDAFLREGGFFETYYPCPASELQVEYDELKQFIVNKIREFRGGEIDSLPSWIYSYMLEQTITIQSSAEDIKYLNDLGSVLQVTALPEFTKDTANMCYEVSTKWIKKLPSKQAGRPATVFGEPHVIKSLRLSQSDTLSTGV